MLYKTAKHLGGGLEGEVYHIGTNLVEKRWGSNGVLFSTHSGDDVKDFIARYKKIIGKYHRLPAEVREHCAVPEFAGYELRAGLLVTFHEYVKGQKLKDKEVEMKIFWEIQDHFGDAWYDEVHPEKGNIIYSKGKFYLVDVA